MTSIDNYNNVFVPREAQRLIRVYRSFIIDAHLHEVIGVIVFEPVSGLLDYTILTRTETGRDDEAAEAVRYDLLCDRIFEYFSIHFDGVRTLTEFENMTDQSGFGFYFTLPIPVQAWRGRPYLSQISENLVFV